MPHSSDSTPFDPPAPIRDAVALVVRRVMNRGRYELERAASRGKSRLELRQLHHDVDHFWQRLGKEAYHLVEAGEIDHPALRKTMARLADLEQRIARQEASLSSAPPETHEKDAT